MIASSTTHAGERTHTLRPALERALLAHYGRQNRTLLVWFWCSFATAVLIAAWAVITRPDELWFSPPILALGVPAVIGAVISDVLLALSRRQHLLARLRAGAAIRRVQRGPFAILVELADGRVSTVPSADDTLLTRIEELLRLQMEASP